MVNHKVKIKRKKTKESNFIRKNFVNYLKFSTPKELFFDIIIPLLISILLTFFVIIIIPSPRDFTIIMKELSSIAITIIAILAGFNTASLAIIASTKNNDNSIENNEDFIDDFKIKVDTPENLSMSKKVKELIVNTPSNKGWQGVISFFAYAVISQLIILIFSLIINISITSLLSITTVLPKLDDMRKYLLLTLFSLTWIFSILHSIFLSIRNIDMISHFIKYNTKK